VETVADLERAVQLNPEDWQARQRLGAAYARQGRPAEAAGHLREALRLNPASADMQAQLGAILTQQRKFAEAVPAFEEALRLRPDFAEARHSYGTALLEMGKLEPAIGHFRHVLASHPNAAAVHSNLGVALATLGRFEEAIDCYRRAVQLNPSSPLSYNNLGEGLRNLGRLEEAVGNFRRALQLRPQFAEAHNNLGIALRYLGRTEEALASFHESIRLKPEYPEAHVNLAFVYLATGQFEPGWREYEWRWKSKALPPRPFPQPRWDGSPLGGRTILLHAEQGLGDTIQFVRYAPMVKERGGRVIVETQDVLIPLLSGCPGIDQLVAQGGPLPAFDCHAPLMSLPGIFGTTLANIPARIPYLACDQERRQRWQPRLRAEPGFRIGIAWHGGPKYAGNRRRSFALAHFAHLARVPGVRLFSLQKGLGREQLEALNGQFPVIDLGAEVDETGGAFMDTAAVLQDLDLVVTVDSSLAHVAGALGVPVWVALGMGPDFRWLLGREDSPWYPTMRLFRQTGWGDWDDLFRRIAREVEQLLSRKSAGSSVWVQISPGELIDKITILEIKKARLTDPGKRKNVETELATLRAAQGQLGGTRDRLPALTKELKQVNERLWEIEDEIRLCERAGDFGKRFIALARAVYHENDRRAELKRQINELLGSRLIEEKQYCEYKR
jgi:Flp pilus assembly protein TadD